MGPTTAHATHPSSHTLPCSPFIKWGPPTINPCTHPLAPWASHRVSKGTTLDTPGSFLGARRWSMLTLGAVLSVYLSVCGVSLRSNYIRVRNSTDCLFGARTSPCAALPLCGPPRMRTSPCLRHTYTGPAESREISEKKSDNNV